MTSSSYWGDNTLYFDCISFKFKFRFRFISFSLLISSFKELLVLFNDWYWGNKVSYFDLYSVACKLSSSILLWSLLKSFNNLSNFLCCSSYKGRTDSYLSFTSFNSFVNILILSFKLLFSFSRMLIFCNFASSKSYSRLRLSNWSAIFFNSSFSSHTSLYLFSRNFKLIISCFNSSFSPSKFFICSSFLFNFCFNKFINFVFCWIMFLFSSLSFFSWLFSFNNSTYFCSKSAKDSICLAASV